MDLNIVTLEIADLIIHFDYFDTLVSDAIAQGADRSEEQTKLRHKSMEHLVKFLDGVEYYTAKHQLRPLSELKQLIKEKLVSIKASEVHDVIEALQKDGKKMKKLYKSCAKK